MKERDYSMLGADGARAVESGLATAEWYHSAIARQEMKALMRREDGPAIRDSLILFACMALFAGAGIALWPHDGGSLALWPSLISLPFWLAYGVLYGSAMDSRWHECGHGTAFRTGWMNDAVYQIASFMMVRNPVTWRWSHARHHTDTLIVGRDPEIVAMRPPKLARILANVFGLVDAWRGWTRMLANAAGRLTPDEASFIPAGEQAKAIRAARIWLVIYALILATAVWLGSMLPLMLVGLPRLYGAWHHVLTGVMQHAGLAEDVLDHRLNSRTVYINPVSRFIYWNMNYHIEHHMFPMVPYYRLPELHAKIKHDLPAPSPSMWAAYREFVPVLLRQLRNQDAYIKRDLPLGAQPYREDLHAAELAAA